MGHRRWPWLFRSSRGNERGNAAIELAFLAPVLVLLLAGILEFGRVMEVWIVTTNAAREGARVAAQGRPLVEVQALAEAYLEASLAGRTDVHVGTITVTNAAGAPGQPVTVGVTANVAILTPLIADFFPVNPVPVFSTLTMRLQ